VAAAQPAPPRPAAAHRAAGRAEQRRAGHGAGQRTQSFTLGQSLGFGLGSGLGYVLAVLLVTEARHRLRSRAIPKAFRGLPITLVYIGVLALAIYGFTGHSVIL